jgi:hypothetical protein
LIKPNKIRPNNFENRVQTQFTLPLHPQAEKSSATVVQPSGCNRRIVCGEMVVVIH